MHFPLPFVQFSLDGTIGLYGVWGARERPVSMPVGKEYLGGRVLSPEIRVGGGSSPTVGSQSVSSKDT